MSAQRGAAGSARPRFALDAAGVELLLHKPHRAEFGIAAEDEANEFGLAVDDDELVVLFWYIALRHAAHPRALAFRGGGLVADALADDLALELRKGQREPSRVKRPTSFVVFEPRGDRNKGGALSHFDDLGKIGERAGQPVDFVDDGGFSGATMDRPALQRLLADIAAGRIDTIVVYKIDRLTRSLADFAKIVEILDQRSASFVSVTQQFNTTTSMGRLTLNVLLSFAQFEREVIGERIRDKIAASKRKGMWMGGVPPLGYRVEDRKLLVIDSEAEIVRSIFRRYAELGSVRLLKQELDARGIKSKSWTSASGRLDWRQAILARRALPDAAEPYLSRRDRS